MKNLLKKIQKYKTMSDKVEKKLLKNEILETLKTLRLENTDMGCCKATMYNEHIRYIPCDKCYGQASNDCEVHKRKELLSILTP